MYFTWVRDNAFLQDWVKEVAKSLTSDCVIHYIIIWTMSSSAARALTFELFILTHPPTQITSNIPLF